MRLETYLVVSTLINIVLALFAGTMLGGGLMLEIVTKQKEKKLTLSEATEDELKEDKK